MNNNIDNNNKRKKKLLHGKKYIVQDQILLKQITLLKLIMKTPFKFHKKKLFSFNHCKFLEILIMESPKVNYVNNFNELIIITLIHMMRLLPST